MADFVTVQVKASKKVIDAMVNSVPGHDFEGLVDFNCIVPTPAYVYQGEGDLSEWENRGEWTWHSWNNRFWGCKWNAAETLRKSDESVYFTAADKPREYLLALSAAFPQEDIFVRFAGETGYAYAGYESYRQGMIIGNSHLVMGFRSPEMKRFGYKVRNRLYA